jgi:hypothetical protein
MLPPNPLHPLLYRFDECAHHPARFIIFAELALFYMFTILIVPILPIVETCDIAQTVYNATIISKTSFWAL